MILEATLQRCRREVQTSEWLFISYSQWLNMNSPFPYDPGTCRWPVGMWFPFHQQSLTWNVTFPVRSKWKWSHIVRVWGVCLQTPSPAYLCALPLKDPQGRSLSQLPLKVTELSPLLPCQRNTLIWCLLNIPSFLPPQRESWFPSTDFSLSGHAKLN